MVGHNLSEAKHRIHLVKVRSSCNERRFYTLEAGKDLFGPTLVRHWGRIGGACHQMLSPFSSDAEVKKAMARLSQIKRRRGYIDAAFWPAQPPTASISGARQP
jgi:predicted DNA-binding WGR domain protein